MRILILSASTGGGHKRASQALNNYILKNEPENIVEIKDCLELVGHLFNKAISNGYTFMAKKTPKMYGNFYDISNRDTTLNSMLTKVMDQMAKKMYPPIEDFNPDVIITMHPFAGTMLKKLKDDGKIDVPFVSVLTDFAPHKTYVNDRIDAYIVSSQEMVDSLATYGIDRNIIHSVGIPIDPAFYDVYDKKEIFSSIGLNENMKTLLIMAGSFGVTDILKIYQNISEIEEEFQIILITGKNQKLYDSFEKMFAQAMKDKKYKRAKSLKELHKGKKMHVHKFKGINEVIEKFIDDVSKEYQNDFTKLLKDKNSKYNSKYQQKKTLLKFKVKKTQADVKEELLEITLVQKLYKGDTSSVVSKPTKLLYFVNDVNKYMAVADLIITKPGGLTVSESVASMLPMAIFQAFPGQEEENASYLIRNNMAVSLPKGKDCKTTIQELITHPTKLEEMKNACKTFYNERSAQKVYEIAKQLVEESEKPDKVD